MEKVYFLILILITTSSATWVKIFDDPFTSLDNWTLETIDGSQTGNQEWQHYTARSENVFLRENSLVLRAQAEEYQSYHFTSGRVHSKKAFGPYGFFNIKAKVPKGKALWPAIWLLPMSSPYGTWAACGEIDIMETICEDEAGFATLHFGQPWPKNVQYPKSPANKYPAFVDWGAPHWFGVDWQPDFITFYLDADVVNGQLVGGTVLNKISSDHWFSADSQGKSHGPGAPYNTPFNIILNVAVGGNWPCSVSGCCSNVAVPAEMVVHNVQVWEKTSDGKFLQS